MLKRKYFCFFVWLAGLFFLFAYKEYVVGSSVKQEDETIVNDYYEQYYDSADIHSIEKELEGINRKYGRNDAVSFEEIFSLLLEGNVDAAIGSAVSQLFENVTFRMKENSELFIKLVLLVLIAAIFNTYSSMYQFSYVGEQGFFVTYIMIAMLLLQSFSFVFHMAEDTIYYINEIIKCLLPALYMSLMLCSGLTTSHMVNTMFLWMLSIIEKVLLGVVLPGIQIYFLVILLNQVSNVDRFSKMAHLLKQGLQWILKGIVTAIIGLNVVKSILVPVYDNAKYNVLQKGLSIVPGGATLSGLSTLLLGAGVLIKNSVGVTVVLILLVLGMVPILEVAVFFIVYKVILAMVQPISDERILKGLQGAADSTGILLRATTTSIVLSVLSVAIVLLTTNVKLYTG